MNRIIQILFCFLILAGSAGAQDLGELSWEEDRGVTFLFADPDQSLLIVESTVKRLSFESNRGIISADEQEAGVWYVRLEPGVQLVTIRAEGYLPLRMDRYAYQPKTVRKIKVKAETIVEGEGTLVISSTPPGATIRLNDIELADATPMTLPRQKTGGYIVELAGLQGYADVETTAVVRKGETTRLAVPLPKLVAGLKVTSDPSGAMVVLDGEELGRTPITRTELTPGDKTLAVILDGYEANTQSVRLVTGETRTVNTYLVRVTGRIEVRTVPAGAEVTLDGAALGVYEGAPLVKEKLEPGRYTLRAALNGYHEVTRTVDVTGGRTAEVSLSLEAMSGAIYVISTPGGASVELDGRDAGVTTPGRINDVSPGTHEITLRKSGFQEAEVRATVEPGKTATVTVTLEEERQAPKPSTTTSSGSGRPGSTTSDPLPGMEFAYIPAGSFMMGSPSNEKNRDSDETQHRVTISQPFEMMTTEVTQVMWRSVMGNNPSKFSGDKNPVEQVSWNDIQDFLRKLNARDPGKGYRLPTEAEWEYACRAGTTTRFWSGDRESDLARVGWYDGNSGGKTHPVAQKPANAWGLYDMHGNVWEWCADWYGDYSSGSVTDPKGPSSGVYRVLRGGSWSNIYGYCRSADRDGFNPSYRNYYYGFRVVRSSVSP